MAPYRHAHEHARSKNYLMMHSCEGERTAGGSDRCASTQMSVDTHWRLKVGIKQDERMNDGGGEADREHRQEAVTGSGRYRRRNGCRQTERERWDTALWSSRQIVLPGLEGQTHTCTRTHSNKGQCAPAAPPDNSLRDTRKHSKADAALVSQSLFHPHPMNTCHV